MVTNTHVALDIGNHTKVNTKMQSRRNMVVVIFFDMYVNLQIICLPLGMKAKQAMLTKGIMLLSKPYKKNTVLRINNSGWGDRWVICCTIFYQQFLARSPFPYLRMVPPSMPALQDKYQRIGEPSIQQHHSEHLHCGQRRPIGGPSLGRSTGSIRTLSLRPGV